MDIDVLDYNGVTTLTEEYDGRYAGGAHSHALSSLTGAASVSQMPEGFVQQFAMSETDWAALPSSGRVAGAMYYTWEA